MMFVRLAFVSCVLFLGLGSTAWARAGVVSFDSVALSPDGKRAVDVESTDPGPQATVPAVRRLVLRMLATGRSIRIACPSSHAPCTLHAPVWSPDGARIAFIARNERARTSSVWTVEANGAAARAWLPVFSGSIESPRWSPDSRSIAVLATAGAHKDIGATQAGAALTGEISKTLSQDVQRIAIIAPGRGLRFASPPDLFIYEYDWMPRGGGFVATAAYGNGDNNWWIAKLYRIDGVRRGARVLYAPELQINAPRVSPDGSHIAFIGGLMSDFGSVGGDVFVVPERGGRAVDVTPGIRASVEAIDWHGSNARVIATGLSGANAFVGDIDVAARRTRVRWQAPESIAGDDRLDIALARDAHVTAVVRQTFEQPPEILTGSLGTWKALTHVNAGVSSAVHARSVGWTNDGFAISGWLLAPATVRTGASYPLIVQIHGGPSAAARPRFVARGDIKDLVERGYFVFLPNPRGSYGQGERFARANVRDFGYGDLRDVLRGVDAVERVAPVDERRLGLMGWSYGGYMTMWAVTQTHRFRAAVAGAGIANWQSYYGQNGIDRWMIPFFGATVYDDPAVYARSSPITFIRNVKTPTLTVVGERDIECPAPQSLEFWHALATRGVPSSLVIYAGEGHRISKPADRRDISRRTLRWFKRYIGS